MEGAATDDKESSRKYARPGALEVEDPEVDEAIDEDGGESSAWLLPALVSHITNAPSVNIATPEHTSKHHVGRLVAMLFTSGADEAG